MPAKRNSTVYPDVRARLNAGVGLAMLPVGVVLGLAAALAAIALLVGGGVALVVGDDWRLSLWCVAAAAGCAWIARAAIEVVSAFDWRPLPRVAFVVAVIVAACPWWW